MILQAFLVLGRVSLDTTVEVKITSTWTAIRLTAGGFDFASTMRNIKHERAEHRGMERGCGCTWRVIKKYS